MIEENNSECMQESIDSELLDEIVASADEATVIVKEVAAKRKKKSEQELYFDIDEDNDDMLSLNINLIKYINDKHLTVQELFDFCIARCDGNKKLGERLAYNIKQSLTEKRNIRSDTIDVLCEFLKVDIVLEPRD